ncbi:MAG: glycoside hydrolase family 9 protein [Firmicutes bacterium]|nr:glycoside hydrolase family 9 protein [Bacillota bacterium]
MQIAVNQAGYPCSGEKLAYVRGATVDHHYQVIDSESGQVVMRCSVWCDTVHPQLAEQVRQLDFTALYKPGLYRIQEAGGHAVSSLFAVQDAVYRPIWTLAMRSYHLQRCGIALDDAETGLAHAPCHTRLAVIRATGEAIDVAGGWHDAGDYGRYTQTAAVTVGQLLMLRNLAPKTLSDDDAFLSEIRYELEWLLKMQREDGGVYHKVNTARFCGMVLPEADEETLLVYDVATPDTAVFCAAMARAARVFEASDVQFTAFCREAARRAWVYLQGAPPFLDPPNDGTGAYRTRTDADERLWAGVEMWLLTGDERIGADLAHHYAAVVPSEGSFGPANWEDVTALAVLALARSERQGTPTDADSTAGLATGPMHGLAERARADLDAHARRIVHRIQQDPYHCALTSSEYEWASVKSAAAYGVDLAVAWLCHPDPEYLAGARHQLAFACGANPLGRSFVTGLGEHCARYPHHRLAVATGRLVPGLVVGGPNAHAYRQDKVTPMAPGPLAYVDDARAYASNEYAIDYNAPLVMLAVLLDEVDCLR